MSSLGFVLTAGASRVLIVASAVCSNALGWAVLGPSHALQLAMETVVQVCMMIAMAFEFGDLVFRMLG